MISRIYLLVSTSLLILNWLFIDLRIGEREAMFYGIGTCTGVYVMIVIATNMRR